MSTIMFDGQPCYEKPLSEGGHWICQHLRQLIEAIGADEQALVRQILVGANKQEHGGLRARTPSFGL